MDERLGLLFDLIQREVHVMTKLLMLIGKYLLTRDSPADAVRATASSANFSAGVFNVAAPPEESSPFFLGVLELEALGWARRNLAISRAGWWCNQVITAFIKYV